ncbi:MAG: ATP-binding protein [bacterium]
MRSRRAQRRGLPRKWPRLRPNILLLLLGVAVTVLLAPALVIAQLRLYSDALVHETERSLIAESVQIGESWRQSWAEALGQHLPDEPLIDPEAVGPIEEGGETLRSIPYVSGHLPTLLFAPVQPEIDLRKGIAPRMPPPTGFAADRSGLEWRIGERFSQILRRAKRMNLSGARILDRNGCVVATSGTELGACFDQLPEVQAALRGEYEAVARRRDSDRPVPPLGSLRRRGNVRVHTAMPIRFHDEVVGVVSMSRTSLDPLEALWHERHWIMAVGAVTLAVTLAMSFLSARAIARPVRKLTAAAREVARGGARGMPVFGRLAPAEIDELSIAMDRMTEELGARADYVRDFAADVTHELKAPLTSIGGAAELLRDGWAEMSDEQRARFLDNIAAATARSERLVSRLLELARIENRRSADVPAPLELRPVVEQILEPYGTRVRLDVRDAPATLAIQPELLASALTNVIDNAIRYDGGKPVEVRVSGHGSAPNGASPQVRITVRDHGPGISDRNQARIFERFFTTERDGGGTGLGLAIVKAIADARGGAVSFETGPQGTTFTVVL